MGYLNELPKNILSNASIQCVIVIILTFRIYHESSLQKLLENKYPLHFDMDVHPFFNINTQDL